MISIEFLIIKLEKQLLETKYMVNKMTYGYKIHKAEKEDIPLLIKHHRMMFEEIWSIRKLNLNNEKLVEMDASYKRKLSEEISGQNYRGFIVSKDNNNAASGSVSILSMVPNPDFSNYKMAYIHSIYTEKDHRNKGLARFLVLEILKYLRSNGIKRAFLNASDAGKKIYENIGFVFHKNQMTIDL